MKKIDFNHLLAILANAGVIVGIFFLGYELRQNTDAIRATASQDMARELANFNLNWTRPDLAAIRLKLISDGYSSLSEIEQQQMDGMDRAFLQLHQNLYYQFLNGALDPGIWSGRHRTLVAIFRQEHIQQQWADGPGGLSDPFIEYIYNVVLPEARNEASD